MHYVGILNGTEVTHPLPRWRAELAKFRGSALCAGARIAARQPSGAVLAGRQCVALDLCRHVCVQLA